MAKIQAAVSYKLVSYMRVLTVLGEIGDSSDIWKPGFVSDAILINSALKPKLFYE